MGSLLTWQIEKDPLDKHMNTLKKVALLHGAGYAGGALINILSRHPNIHLALVTSRSFSGKPVWHAHPAMRGHTDLVFSSPDSLQASAYDGLLVAGEHGQSAKLLGQVITEGYTGVVVDLSADFRLKNAKQYEQWYGYEHPYPKLLNDFVYGIPEIFAPYPSATQCIANPGCFATAIILALYPLSMHAPDSCITVTALTGASGSGARPKATTHFPTRAGNVRAYKVLNHQHLPEITAALNDKLSISFIPVSGPWTRGIWGTAQMPLSSSISAQDVEAWFTHAYNNTPLIRLWPNQLPELRYSANTPFADIGWVIKDHQLVIGFSIDNLLKGAASQAIQNLNMLFGLNQAMGLLPLNLPVPTA